MNYEIHPLANIFPMMDDANLKVLAEDIKVNGLEHDLVLYKGKLLDGRNRLKACEIAGLEEWRIGVCEICEDLDEDFDPLKFVLTANLHRRHLTEAQRSMVAGEIKKVYSKQAKERQKEHGGTAPGKKKTLPENLPEVNKGDARDKAAEALNVSGRSVDHASKVIEKGSKLLNEAVKQGEVAVSTAAKLAKLPKSDQDKAVRGGKKAIKEAVAAKGDAPVSTTKKKRAAITALGRKSVLTALESLVRASQAAGVYEEFEPMISKMKSTIEAILEKTLTPKKPKLKTKPILPEAKRAVRIASKSLKQSLQAVGMYEKYEAMFQGIEKDLKAR